MEELHELIKYLKDNGYEHLKINPDLLIGIIEYFASKQETKQCTITDVVKSFPNDEEVKAHIETLPYYGTCTTEYNEGFEDGIKWLKEISK